MSMAADDSANGEPVEETREGRTVHNTAPLLNQIEYFNTVLSVPQLDSIKLACRALGITQDEIDGTNSFAELYSLIENLNKERAPSLVYAILLRVDCLPWQLANVEGLSEAHNKSPVDINEINDLDLRLTLSDIIIRGMNDEVYGNFKRHICSSYLRSPSNNLRSYHPDQVKSRCHLVQLILDREKTPNFGLILACFEECQCYEQFKENIFEYCARQKLTQPTPDRSIVFSTEDNKDFGFIDKPRKQEKSCFCQCNCRCVCCTFCLVVTFFIFLTFCAVFLGLQIPWFSSTDSYPSSRYYYGANTTVFVGNFSSYSTRSVTIATNNSINIHRVDTSNNYDFKNITRPIKLPHKTLTRPGDDKYVYNNNRTNFMNYFGVNYPLYTAGDGHITYWIKLVTYGHDTPCPLQVVAFTSHALFHQFLFLPYLSKIPPGAYSNTSCLHGNTTHNHTFFLEGNSFYYFTLSHAAKVSFQVNASGEVYEYSSTFTTSHDATQCNPQTISNELCEVEISQTNLEGRIDYHEWSLYASSNITDQDELVLRLVPVTWRISGVVLLVCACLTIIIFFIALCICCYKCRTSSNGKNKRHKEYVRNGRVPQDICDPLLIKEQ